VSRGQRDGSLRLYSRLSRPDICDDNVIQLKSHLNYTANFLSRKTSLIVRTEALKLMQFSVMEGDVLI
jgi:hypothetical protein